MRVLLVDHGCCDPPDTRVHACRTALMRLGAVPLALGPSSVSSLAAETPGLRGVHLRDIAAANKRFLRAVQDGSPAAFLAASATISPSLLGLVRETARQTIAEAVDAFEPDVIFVLHAGILVDLAIETGVPVALHVSGADLGAAATSERIRDLVISALSSVEALIATDGETADVLARDWLDRDETDQLPACEVWPVGAASAPAILAACERARDRRR